MSAERKKQASVLGLIVALVVVLIGSILFVGAASGWFDDPKVLIDAEYRCEEECGDSVMMELSAEQYEDLVRDAKSFVVFIDQDGCTTADRLEGYVTDWGKTHNTRFFKMMFSDIKTSSLHDNVKYYPSVAIVSSGHVVTWLRADSDDDAEMYNNQDSFNKWIERRL